MSSTVLDLKLLTEEEYGRLPNDGRLTALVRGRIVEMNRPYTAHGYYMNRLGYLLTQFVEQQGLGRVVVGNAGVVTARNPDTVRRGDVEWHGLSGDSPFHEQRLLKRRRRCPG